MIDSATKGDLLRFKEALQRQGDVSADQMKSALIAACKGGNLEIVKIILGLGANPNTISETHNWTPIHIAVEHGHVEIVRFLIQEGANPDLPDLVGMTPLHLAVDVACDVAHQTGRETSTEEIKALLELGADPMVVSGDGDTALDIARDYGCEGVEKILLEWIEHPMSLHKTNPRFAKGAPQPSSSAVDDGSGRRHVDMDPKKKTESKTELDPSGRVETTRKSGKD